MLSGPKEEWACVPGPRVPFAAGSWEFRGHGLRGRERHPGCLVPSAVARVSLCVFVAVFSEMPTLKPTKLPCADVGI